MTDIHVSYWNHLVHKYINEHGKGGYKAVEGKYLGATSDIDGYEYSINIGGLFRCKHLKIKFYVEEGC